MQRAKGEAQVVEQAVEEGETAGFAIALPGLFEAPEVEERLAAGLLGAHAPSEVSFEGHLQVRTQLGVEVVIELCTAEEGAQTVEPLAKPGDHL